MAEATPSDKAAPSATTRSTGTRTSRPQVSGLKAGFADDNKQFNLYVHFQEEYGNLVNHYTLPIQERIILKITDNQGNSIPNARIKIFSANRQLESGVTYADGTYLFFPSEYSKLTKEYRTEITYRQRKKQITIQRGGNRQINIQFSLNRLLMQNVPLDILFVFDTTGSMGDEISRLKKTILCGQNTIRAL